jgi:hypothetical protein
MIWMDGRPHPSDYYAHSWEGFSTGKWEGDTLTITSTHLKESFMRRNGTPASFHRTVTEHVSLDEPYITWVIAVNDPMTGSNHCPQRDIHAGPQLRG